MQKTGIDHRILYRNFRRLRVVLAASKQRRFAIVGAVNTALDFGIFMALSDYGMHPIPANYLSTSVALSFSFAANKRFTFQRPYTRSIRWHLAMFMTVTLFGLWVLQPVLIAFVLLFVPGDNAWGLLFSKGVATVVTLLWNFFMYDRFVFK